MITFPNAKINLGLNIVESAGWIPQSGNHILSDKPASTLWKMTRRENNDKEYTLHISGSPLEGETRR